MPGETEPRENWVLCDGGEDGHGGTVPDMRGRVVLGASEAHPAGSAGGSETHEHGLAGTVGETTLTVAQLASHTHTIRRGDQASWDWLSRGSDDYGSAYQAEATGGSQPHEHPLEGTTNQADSLPPFLSFHMVMRTA